MVERQRAYVYVVMGRPGEVGKLLRGVGWAVVGVERGGVVTIIAPESKREELNLTLRTVAVGGGWDLGGEPEGDEARDCWVVRVGGEGWVREREVKLGEWGKVLPEGVGLGEGEGRVVGKGRYGWGEAGVEVKRQMRLRGKWKQLGVVVGRLRVWGELRYGRGREVSKVGLSLRKAGVERGVWGWVGGRLVWWGMSEEDVGWVRGMMGGG